MTGKAEIYTFRIEGEDHNLATAELLPEFAPKIGQQYKLGIDPRQIFVIVRQDSTDSKIFYVETLADQHFTHGDPVSFPSDYLRLKTKGGGDLYRFTQY